MKIVRLTIPEFRQWRENMSRVVDEEGISVREISLEEGDTFRQLDKLCLSLRQTHSAVMDEGMPTERVLKVVPTTGGSGHVTLARTMGEHRVLDGRVAMTNAFAKVHGPEFQLRTIGGKFPIKSVHAERRHASSGVVGVPHPDHCQCSAYAGRMVGRHHKICQWNAKAPSEQQALADGVVVQQATPAGPSAPTMPVAPRVRFLPAQAAPLPGVPNIHAGAGVPSPFAKSVPAPGGGVVPPIMTKAVIIAQGVPVAPVVQAPVAVVAAPVPVAVPEPPKFYSPADCPNVCLGDPKTGQLAWSNNPNPGQHHPICQWKASWEAAQTGAEPKVLVDLETKTALRAATDEEIAEASENLGIATVDEKKFAVLPASELSAGA